MPVEVAWENDDKTVVRYTFRGKWTWDELYPVYYQALEMERSVTHRVDVILDMLESGWIPANALLHIKNIAEKQPPNIGVSVFVSKSTLIHTLYETGVRFNPKIGFYFRVAKTVEQAQAMIERLAGEGLATHKPLTDSASRRDMVG